MAPAPGVIELELHDEDGQKLEEICRRNPGSSQPWDYLMLGPGDAISRLLTLTCYDLPKTGRISARVKYLNTDPDAPPSPLQLLPLFRGPVGSNTVVFTLQDE